jgi:hypothetical protein
MELIIGFFKGFNSFLELNMMHEEIAEKMMKVRMYSITFFNNICKIVKTFVILVLRLEYPSHEKVLKNEVIWVVYCEVSLQGS